MMLRWRSIRYRGGAVMFDAPQRVFALIGLTPGTAAAVAWFNGLTTSQRLTGVGA